MTELLHNTIHTEKMVNIQSCTSHCGLALVASVFHRSHLQCKHTVQNILDINIIYKNVTAKETSLITYKMVKQKLTLWFIYRLNESSQDSLLNYVLFFKILYKCVKIYMYLQLENLR